jgi:hypothetical protein
MFLGNLSGPVVFEIIAPQMPRRRPAKEFFVRLRVIAVLWSWNLPRRRRRVWRGMVLLISA